MKANVWISVEDSMILQSPMMALSLMQVTLFRYFLLSVKSNEKNFLSTLFQQELGGITTAMDRQKLLLQELTSNVKDMLRNTEIAVRSFMILRSRFQHPNKATTTTPPQAPGAPPTTTTTTTQPTTSAIVPVYDFYTGLPRKPSPFFQQTVARFDKYLHECRQWVEELEQLLLESSKNNSMNSNPSLLESLPKVMSNVHDFFVYVASKVNI